MSNTKRIVFITGDKGGVGKSFVARALAQYYLDKKIPFHGYDIDPVNPNLHQFYPQCTSTINLEKHGELDLVHDDLGKHSLLLVDCAARSITEIAHWFNEMRIFKQLPDLRLSLTFAFVITPDKSCTVIMKDALERFGHEASFFVVKNYAKGEDFSIYEESNLRKRFLAEFHGKEITMPQLLERTVVHLDSLDIAFGDAMYHPELTMSDRSRVFGFLDEMYEQFEIVRPWLIPEEGA